MTPAQSALILHALGLTPRDGVMPRWSSQNFEFVCRHADDGDKQTNLLRMAARRWMRLGRLSKRTNSRFYHVTRLGAEAAGVLGRCRMEDVRR